MKSLTREAANITRERDSWFDSMIMSVHKRRIATTTESPKRRRIANPSDLSRSRGHSVELAEADGSSNSKRVFGETVSAKRVYSWEDEDYMGFLGIFCEHMNVNVGPKEVLEIVDDDDGVSSEEDDVVDPHYKMFLENVREDGISYVLELEKEVGVIEVIRYEEEDEGLGGEDVDDVVPSQERREGLDVVVKPRMEPLDDGGGYVNGQCDSVIPGGILYDCQSEMISEADKCYLEFLRNAWVKDGRLTLEKENDIVRFGQDIQVVTELEEPEVKPTLLANVVFSPDANPRTIELATEDDTGSVEILDGSVNISYEQMFRKKLRKLLRKPFDKKEYDEKLKDAKTRKQLEKTRVTRGREISYPTDENSPSYLDLHLDLKKMLKGAIHEGCLMRALAILRCLFFYYENLSHSGSFVPWLNPPSWLHDKICSCTDNSRCPTKNFMSHGKRRRL